MTNKVLCKECKWHGTVDELLKAPNPFNILEEIDGCPQCFTPNSMVNVCIFESCWKEAICSHTCAEHFKSKEG